MGGWAKKWRSHNMCKMKKQKYFKIKLIFLLPPSKGGASPSQRGGQKKFAAPMRYAYGAGEKNSCAVCTYTPSGKPQNSYHCALTPT